MDTLKVSRKMRKARDHINEEKKEIEERIDQLLIIQGKLESLKSQSSNLKLFYDRLVEFTRNVLKHNIRLKKMLRRLFFFKIFTDERKEIEKKIKLFRFDVRKEEINLNLYKQNMRKVCQINNHTNGKICIFCL